MLLRIDFSMDFMIKVAAAVLPGARVQALQQQAQGSGPWGPGLRPAVLPLWAQEQSLP